MVGERMIVRWWMRCRRSWLVALARQASDALVILLLNLQNAVQLHGGRVVLRAELYLRPPSQWVAVIPFLACVLVDQRVHLAVVERKEAPLPAIVQKQQKQRPKYGIQARFSSLNWMDSPTVVCCLWPVVPRVVVVEFLQDLDG